MSWRACIGQTNRWAHTCPGAQVTFLQWCLGCYTLWSHSPGKSKQRCLLRAGHLLSLRARWRLNCLPQGPAGVITPTTTLSRGSQFCLPTLSRSALPCPGSRSEQLTGPLAYSRQPVDRCYGLPHYPAVRPEFDGSPGLVWPRAQARWMGGRLGGKARQEVGSVHRGSQGFGLKRTILSGPLRCGGACLRSHSLP